MYLLRIDFQKEREREKIPEEGGKHGEEARSCLPLVSSARAPESKRIINK